MASNEVLIKVTAKDGASATFQKVGQSAGQMGTQVEQATSKSSRSFDSLNKAGALWGATAGAVGDLVRASTAAYAEAEAAQLRLQSAVENSGQSFDAYKQQIDAAIESSMQLGFDDEATSDALATLTQATGNASTAMADLAMVQDLARAKNMSLAEAAKVVADAEAGRMRGLQSLGLGIDATMSKEEAFGIILQKTGGTADEFAGTTTAAIARFQTSVGNAMEAVGKHVAGIAPYMQVTSQSFTVLGGIMGALAPNFSLVSAAQAAYAAITGTTATTQQAAAATATELAAAETAAGAGGVAGAAGITAVGAASTAAAVEMEVASVASKGLMASLGPVGLALMAVTAVAGLAMLVSKSDETDKALNDAYAAANQASEGFRQLANDMSQTAAVREFASQVDGLIDLTMNVNSNLRGQVAALSEVETAYQYSNDTVIQLVDGQEQLKAGLSESDYWTVKNIASQEDWNAAMADGKMTGDEWAAIVEKTSARLSEMGASSEDAATATSTLRDIQQHLTDTGVDTYGTIEKVSEAQARLLETGDFTQYIADLEAIQAGMAGSAGETMRFGDAAKYLADQQNLLNTSWATAMGMLPDLDAQIQHIASSMDPAAAQAQAEVWAAMAQLQIDLQAAQQTPELDDDIAAYQAYATRINEANTTLTESETAAKAAEQSRIDLAQAQITAMNSTNQLNEEGKKETATLETQAAAVNTLAEAQRMQAQVTLDNAEAQRQAALAAAGWTEANVQAIIGSTDAQVQAATVQSQAAQLQAETQLEVATASGATTDELAGQASATNALAQAQQLQSQTALDNAEANGQLPPTLAETTIELQTMAGAIDDAQAGVGDIDSAMTGFVGSIEATNPALAEVDENLKFLAGSSEEVQDEVFQLYSDFKTGKITAEEFATRIDELTAAEEKNRGTTAEAEAAAKELQQAWEDATVAALDLILQTDTLAGKLSDLGNGTAAQNLAYNLNMANATADDLTRTIVGNTNAISSAAHSTLDWATELINVRGQWGKIDDLLSRDLIDQSQYDAAQNAYDSIAESTARIDDAVAVIQTNLSPAIAAAQEQQAKYLEDLATMPEAQQMAALGYMDQAESAKAMAAAQQIAAAAQSGNTEATQKMIEQMAMADPVLKAMLVDMGLITDEGNGEISVNWENAGEVKADLDDVVGAIETLSTVLAEAFGIEIDTTATETAQSDIEALMASMGLAQEAATNLQGATSVIPPSVAIGIPIATPTGDDPASVLQEIMDKQATINTTPTSVALQYPQVTAGYTKADDLNKMLITVGKANPKPGVDNADILNAYNSSGWVKDRLDDVDRSYTYPTVDASDIWSAYNAGNTLEDQLSDLDGYVVDVTIRYHEENKPPGAPDITPGYTGLTMRAQDGGIMAPYLGAMASGGMALVGERGPELLWLPTGAQVTNTETTQARIQQNGGTKFQFFAPITVVANDPATFTRKLQSARLMEGRL